MESCFFFFDTNELGEDTRTTRGAPGRFWVGRLDVVAAMLAHPAPALDAMVPIQGHGAAHGAWGIQQDFSAIDEYRRVYL